MRNLFTSILILTASILFGQSQSQTDQYHGTASGTDTYSVTISSATMPLYDCEQIRVKFSNANTGASTLRLTVGSSYSITPIKLNGAALISGDIVSGVEYPLIYNLSSARWDFVRPGSQSTAQTTTVTAGAGIMVAGSAPSYTIANSAPNQTVTITGAGTTTVSGTYPTYTVTGAASGLTIGTTSISSGISGRVLYDNAGVLGEMTTTGSGTVLALQTSPTFLTDITTTKIIGQAIANGTLTITSTSDATKGKIYLGANSVFDETNTRLGIGTISPSILGDFVTSNSAGVLGITSDINAELFLHGLSTSSWRLVSAYNGSWMEIMTGAHGSLMQINTDGNVGIGNSTTAPTARLHVKGSGATSATYSMKIQNNSSTDLFNVRDDGAIGAGTLTNLAIGLDAGIANSGSNYNTFIGYNAGKIKTTGAENTIVGAGSGLVNITGVANTFFGSQTGESSTGSYCTLIGDNAGNSITSGNENTCVGYLAGQAITTGTQNTIIGNYAGYQHTGQGNTLIGYNAGNASNSGSFNTYLGYVVGTSHTGGNSIFLGAYAGYRQTSASNLLIIDNQDRSSSANELIQSLVVGTFTTTPSAQTFTVNAGTVALPYAGTPGVGKVFTSDANGSGTWQQPYKEYVALVSQTGTLVPTATVLNNTLGSTPTYTRNSAGSYEVNCTACFTSNKTTVTITNGINLLQIVGANPYINSPNQVALSSQDILGVSESDDILDHTTLIIRVYP